jgi:outer membrane protein with beta-barrel domain
VRAMKKIMLIVMSFGMMVVLVSPTCNAWNRGEVRISPFFGYVLGGEFDDQFGDYNDYYYGDVELDNAPTLGLRLGVGIGGGVAAEFSVSHMRSEFYRNDSHGFFSEMFEDKEKITDVDLIVVQANMLFSMGRGPVEPYFSFGLGATQFDLDYGNDKTRFTVNMAGGFDVKITEHLGFRSELRGYATYIEEDDSCDYYYGDCYDDDWEYLFNLEATFGLSFRI